MEFLYVVFILYLIINVVVTVFLFRLDTLEQFQKYAQSLIVWIVPFVGALAIWLFNRNDYDNPKSKEFGGGPRDSSGSDAEA